MSRDQRARAETPAKRQSAPISASAFSFTLPQTNTPAKRLKPLVTASSFASPATGTTAGGTTPSRVAKTPTNVIKSETSHQAPTHKLESLPSPLFAGPRTPPTAGPSRPTKRLHELIDEASPFRSRVKPEHQDLTGGVPLGTLPGWDRDLAQGLVEKKRAEFVDEGVGVSPRRTKGLKYTGKGPPPPSTQLTHLLSSANSSLHLFYTSLQQTVQPRDVRKKTAHKSPRDHLRTAPLHLILGQAISPPTHQSVIFRCSTRRGEHEMMQDDTTNMEVQVVFQPVPSECPKIGTDPRAVIKNMNEGTWEVGIWEPWTEVTIPIAASVEEGEMDSQGQSGGGNGAEDSMMVIFATRYLIGK